jgi:hypothetical protein
VAEQAQPYTHKPTIYYTDSVTSAIFLTGLSAKTKRIYTYPQAIEKHIIDTYAGKQLSSAATDV